MELLHWRTWWFLRFLINMCYGIFERCSYSQRWITVTQPLKRKRTLMVWWCVKRQCISYTNGRTKEFSMNLFCSSLFGFTSPLETFRILEINIKELPEICLYTFWVEKFTPDFPYLQTYEQEHTFCNVCLISTIHLNSFYPFGLFHYPWMGVTSSKRSMGKGFWSPYLEQEVFVRRARGPVTDG